MKYINNYILEKLHLNKDLKINDEDVLYNKDYNVGDIFYCMSSNKEHKVFYRIEHKYSDKVFLFSHLYVTDKDTPKITPIKSGQYWWTKKVELRKDNKFHDSIAPSIVFELKKWHNPNDE